MHARVISKSDARKGLFAHWCSQQERPLWRMHATDFWATPACKIWGASRMRAPTSAGNPSNHHARLLSSFCTQPERSQYPQFSKCQKWEEFAFYDQISDLKSLLWHKLGSFKWMWPSEITSSSLTSVMTAWAFISTNQFIEVLSPMGTPATQQLTRDLATPATQQLARDLATFFGFHSPMLHTADGNPSFDVSQMRKQWVALDGQIEWSLRWKFLQERHFQWLKINLIKRSKKC